MTTVAEELIQLGINFGFENLLELEEQLKEYHILCQIKTNIDEEIEKCRKDPERYKAIQIGSITKFILQLLDSLTVKICHRCGTQNGLKLFEPTEEEPDVIPIFCHSCFMNPDCIPAEPMTDEEKQKMWDES